MKDLLDIPAASMGRPLRFALGLVLVSAVTTPFLSADSEVYERKWTRAELETTLRESQEWLKNDIGRSEIVPPPWTPMTVEGQSIHSWGKVYRYDNSILPVSLLSQDTELMSGGPVFRLRTGDRWVEFREAEVSIDQRHDGLVLVRSVSRSDGYEIRLDKEYEFDGMGKVTMRLTGPSGARPSGLYLDFPLRAETTTLFHYTGTRSGVRIGGRIAGGAALPPMSDSDSTPAEGIRLDAFRELVWLGNPEVGFTWFANYMKGWPIQNEDDIQVIGPVEDGNRMFTIKFADREFTLEEPLQLVFGIQATPMRPRAKNFRERVGWDRTTENRPFLLQWRWGDGYYYPFQDTFREEARNDVESERAQGREILTTSSTEYFGMYRFSRGKFGIVDHPGMIHREVMFWKDQWDQQRRFEGSVEDALARQAAAWSRREQSNPGGHSVEDLLAIDRHTAPGNDWHGVMWRPTSYPERFCYGSTFADYYVWKLKELVEDTGLRALYLDQQMYQCRNPDHGCGYVDHNGEWVGQGNFFAMRDIMKRAYIMMYELNGQPPEFMWHSSYQVLVPIISFTTIFWDGEKYTHPGHPRSIVGQEFYSSFLSEGLMQVQHTGKAFGFIADFLPQITRDELRGLVTSSPTIATARDMMGLLMIHDSHIDGYGSLTYHGGLIARILNTRMSYPLSEMDVAYYWQPNNGVATAPESVRPILHYGEDQALLILFNWGDETIRAEADLDTDRLGIAATNFQVKDALTGEPIDSNGRRIQTDILPRDFRMLEVNW